jgi:predicted small secreted protein
MRLLVPLAALLAALFLCSCSAGKDVELAGHAVDEFHQQFAAGEDSAIYAAADPAYRAAFSQKANHELLSRIRQKLGACQGARYTSEFVNFQMSGTFVTLSENRNCAHGNLQEVFKWRISSGRPFLYGYRASSPLLEK